MSRMIEDCVPDRIATKGNVEMQEEAYLHGPAPYRPNSESPEQHIPVEVDGVFDDDRDSQSLVYYLNVRDKGVFSVLK